MCQRLQSKAYFGRFGGDEFVLFVCNVESRESIREIIQNELCTISNEVSQEFDIDIAFSGGMAVADTPSHKYEKLFSEADRALISSNQFIKYRFVLFKATQAQSRCSVLCPAPTLRRSVRKH